MKKEYMKPVMESEMFVANEYVANCYIITDKCNHISPYLVKNVNNKNEAYNDFEKTYKGQTTTAEDGTEMFFGSLGGEYGETDNHSTNSDVIFFIKLINNLFGLNIPYTGEHHDLTCVPTAPGDAYDNIGPNAS